MKAWQLPLIAAATASTSVYAVQPQGIQLGSGVTMLPGVEVSISNDSNIYLSDTNETSSRITKIRPNLALVGDLGATQLNAYYQLENGSYSEDSESNYLDQSFVLGVDTEMTSRHALGFDLRINAGHDPKGAGSTQNVDDVDSVDIDEYKELILGVDYTFGATTAFANLTGYLENYGKTYSTNKNLTSQLEHDKFKYGVLAALRVTNATRALLEVRNTTITYSDSAAEDKDGSELKLFAGASWSIAGKTTGSVKLGMADRSFDKSTNDGDSRFSWEAGVTWSPRTYSVVNLTSFQEAAETAGGGSHVATSNMAVNWSHRFSTKFGMDFDLSNRAEEYLNSNDNRDDSTLSYGLSGIFSPNKMLDVKLGLTKVSRDSNVNTFDYDRQIVTLAVALAI